MVALSAMIFLSLGCVMMLNQPASSTATPASDHPDYCNVAIYGHDHTMCLYKERKLGPGCASRKNPHIYEFSDAVKKQIVDAHNEYRSLVALGNEKRGHPGPQPKAANMISVVWDDELATIAERFIIQCKEFEPYAHDVNRYVGNVASNGNIVGHYRQVVYGATSHIGCGGVSWINEHGSPKISVYCNYGGHSNAGREATYTVGSPASKCPTDPATKGNPKTGLCDQLANH